MKWGFYGASHCHIAIEGQPMCEWLHSFKTGVGLVSTFEHTSVVLVLGI
jgi:hypothetical protein